MLRLFMIYFRIYFRLLAVSDISPVPSQPAMGASELEVLGE
jgi:hypothetical protein